MVTPLACGVEPTWPRLLAAESGVKRIEKFDVSDIASQIAGQIPRGDGSNGAEGAALLPDRPASCRRPALPSTVARQPRDHFQIVRHESETNLITAAPNQSV
jgi:3-oxoacyl-(acyl-carrier-protein) synthase